MQEHFGKSMNPARIKLGIKLMTLLLEAPVKAQSHVRGQVRPDGD